MKEGLKNRGLELALFLALAILAGLLVYDKMVIFSVVALTAVAVFFLAGGYRIHIEDRSIIWTLALGALLLRVVFIIATQAFDNPFLKADGITYARIGNEIVQTWHAGDQYIIGKANYGYYYYNAFIFYATGYYPDVVRLINSIIAIGAALNLYFISLNLSGRRAARYTFALTAFFPSFVVWSALNLKESLCVFLITYIVKKIIEIIQEFHFTKLFAIALALLPLVTLRFYVGILLGVVMALTYIFSAVNFNWNKRIIYTLLLVLVVGVSLLQMGYGFLGKDYLASQSLETIGEQHNAGATGDSAYSQEVDFSSPVKALMYLPLGLFYFAFGPLPWQSGGLLKIISMPEMFMLYILYLSVWPGIYRLWRHRRGECLFLLILISCFTLIYALGGSNMGGIYRVRFQVLSILFIFISHGLWGQKQQQEAQLTRSD
ncbi:hypothetical protein SAMN05660649_03086 [Desulfotomaculum arcticum]|uniref:Dolichyl-phosphate-mannose-protein mannosyltransferase n=1 Tax=Desulfotruncus arcticus DSM 17038 TaxID=1121424 RepID=A0A1I2VLJ9_9FIRM|nr:hypothetical protein [Desulfotruncus arcticus]SFG89963.1 hypothetical protein SAMN05660649_03086 [Desulfotomaculum arcticum] [Desulfotruncus arcticus DSM 17038]